MKHTSLLLAMLCISFSLLANVNQSEKNLVRLVRLLPDQVSMNNVKDIFGEATIININNKSHEESWEFKADEYSVSLKWDTKANKLKSMNFHSNETAKQKWSNRSLLSLEVGSATLKQALNELGCPKDLSGQGPDMRLKYTYTDCIVELQFKKGILNNIRIGSAENKENTTYITIQ